MKQFLVAALLFIPAFIRAQVLTPPGTAPAVENKTPATPPATTSTPDGKSLTTEQAASILKQLDQIDNVITKNRDTTLGGALARCIKAESSEKDALDLYLACYKAEHFDRLNLINKDFTDWAKQNEDKLKDPEFQYGLWLQLEFLVIAIKAQDAENLSPLITSLQSFMQKEVLAVQNASTSGGLVKDRSKGGSTKTSKKSSTGQLLARLRENVRQSEFSKTLLLKDMLKREDWEYEPLALGSIYEKIIFPYYLNKKPAELPVQWDNRISGEMALKQALSNEADYTLYYKEHHPVMVWKKSKYLLDHNLTPVPALAAMLQVVRENPTHVNAADWVKELRQIVSNAQTPTTPSSGVTDTSAPAPAVN